MPGRESAYMLNKYTIIYKILHIFHIFKKFNSKLIACKRLHEPILMFMEYKILHFNKEQDLGILTINRPKAMNALNSDFFKEMDAMLEEIAEGKKAIKVLIITGEGKAFAAGADIAEMADMTQTQAKAFSETGQRVFARIEALDIPVIAAVNGYALGGGLELAMACDFRIASEKAKFGQPEVSLGLTPGYAGTQRLPQLVGLADALFMLTTAKHIDAHEALRIRLIQQVVAPEKLVEQVREIAQTIASKGPNAIKKTKMATRYALFSDLTQGSAVETQAFASLFENEGTEGMKAFLEKRNPNW